MIFRSQLKPSLSSAINVLWRNALYTCFSCVSYRKRSVCWRETWFRSTIGAFCMDVAASNWTEESGIYRWVSIPSSPLYEWVCNGLCTTSKLDYYSGTTSRIVFKSNPLLVCHDFGGKHLVFLQNMLNFLIKKNISDCNLPQKKRANLYEK